MHVGREAPSKPEIADRVERGSDRQALRHSRLSNRSRAELAGEHSDADCASGYACGLPHTIER
jgi:hypothetical protein